MIQRQKKKKIVLYQPQQVDASLGRDSSKDMLPLESLAIAAFPLQDGFEVVIIDGSLESDRAFGHKKVVEACEDAILFGSTGILGFMVKDSYQCAERVRAAYPDLKMVVGGWFASVKPELQLRDGVYDAVVCGQGELPFRMIAEAVWAGESISEIPSVSVWEDGAVRSNPRHRAVGWDELLTLPWHILDIEPYRNHQLRENSHQDILRMTSPRWIGERKPYFGVTYFSSFGCPEPCQFCCSPFVTNRRWKAMPAERMLDDIQEMHERWGGFDVLRFHDANFGVKESRVKDFAQGLIDRKLNIGWNSFVETNSILRFDPSTLDLMAESGMYVVEIGAETGTDEFMKEWIGKPIHGQDNVCATKLMNDRGIDCSVTYIIGFPHEERDNMLATLDQCRQVNAAAPESCPTVWPYRPIPGNAMWDEAVKLGFEEPDHIYDWGSLGEYHLHETWPGRIPEDVARVRKLLCHYQTLARGLAREKDGLWERLARWRLKTGNFALGRLDNKLFDLYLKLSKRLWPEEEKSRQWNDIGHKTGTSPSKMATGIDQARTVTESTKANF